MASKKTPSEKRIAEQTSVYQVDKSVDVWLSKFSPEEEDPAHTFHTISQWVDAMSDEARVGVIRHGLGANVARSIGETFAISVSELAKVLLVSESTLTRKSRDNSLLDPSTTERVLRIALITILATDIFEDVDATVAWMTRDNVALGGHTPLSLCDNDISAAQVRRVLHAIDYGGVV